MIHPSGMFWHPRGSGRRPESVYEVTDYFFFSKLGKWCQVGLLGHPTLFACIGGDYVQFFNK